MNGKIKGRGALSNEQGRFARFVHEPDIEALAAAAAADTEPEGTKPPTHLHIDHARTIIARNQSPDIPFDQSVQGLRARLYLLLRARDAFVSRPLAGAGLRDGDFLQAERSRAVTSGALEAWLRSEPDRIRHEHRSVSTRRAAAQRHARADR